MAQVLIDDVIESAANGVIRALDARSAGQERSLTEVANATAAGLVKSGFFVDIRIIAGGYPAGGPLNQSQGLQERQTG